jgi:phosphocarrier protein
VNHRAEAACEIRNELGLHLRAAAAFVKLAERFQSDVTLERIGAAANGKSIIALVTLAAGKGTPVTVVAEGPDAHEAVKALSALIQDRFGEQQ